MKSINWLRYSLRIGVVWGVLWLLNQPWIVAFQVAQGEISSSVSPAGPTSRIFLPWVVGSGSDRKSYSGVHLGNRVSDWNSTLLQRLSPATGGQWPAAVVALSDQVYTINRYPSNYFNPDLRCRVQNATVKHLVIFNYIRQAAQAGARVIFRIYPSPGNFVDVIQPGYGTHQLMFYWSGQDYCHPESYRSVYDVMDEMVAIQNVNTANGFTEFGFEPANEPNAEWYTDVTVPPIHASQAWVDMDYYFSAIYNLARNYHPMVKVLTPPMAQLRYAEGYNMVDCTEQNLFNTDYGGYDFMPQVYGPKNDGVTWHVYWNWGRELYGYCLWSHHVSAYFPQWMKTSIRDDQKAVTITEADLASSLQNFGTDPLLDKSSGNNASTAANSIQLFMYQEATVGPVDYGVSPVIVSWLLSDDTGCQNGNPPCDHPWHVAFDNNTEQLWFNLWYTASEYP